MIITKRPYEGFWRYHEFRRSDGNGWLALGETVVTASVVVTDSTGQDVSGAMVSGVTPNGTPATQVKYYITGGNSGNTYTVEVRIVTSLAQKFEDSFEVKVL